MLHSTAPLARIESSRSTAGYTEDAILRVVRLELQNLLHPVIEAISRSEDHQKTLGLQLQDMAYHLCTRLAQTPAAPKESSPGITSQNLPGNDLEPYHNRESCRAVSDNWYIADSEPSHHSGTYCPVTSFNHLPEYTVTVSRWTYWRQWSWLGTIRVEVKWSVRYNGNRRSKNMEISINFCPSWPLLRRNCVSLLYSTSPVINTYYQLCPLVATFPIISDHAPVWDCIRKNDVDGLRYLLDNGLAGPNDQDQHGQTLLHASCPMIRKCQHANRRFRVHLIYAFQSFVAS